MYCTTPALEGYPSYSVRIPHTRMEPSFHICGTTLHARQHDPFHLLPTISIASVRAELSRAELCIIGSFPDRQLTTTRVMSPTRNCGFHYFGDKGADHCGKGDNRHPDGDKGATRDNRRCHSWKSVFKEMIRVLAMYPPFLTSTLTI